MFALALAAVAWPGVPLGAGEPHGGNASLTPSALPLDAAPLVMTPTGMFTTDDSPVLELVEAAVLPVAGASPAVRPPHLCLVFDGNRRVQAAGFVRSAFLHLFTPAVFHLVTVASDRAYWEALFDGSGHTLELYDVERCRGLVRDVQPFGPRIHYAVHCKVFLADLLPAEVAAVLYADTDAIIAGWGVAQACMPPLDGESYIGMVIDMGDSCQLRPDRCWPLAYEGVVQPGLVCGNTPQRSARHASDARCVEPGEREPLQLNGGLVYMNLTTMRRIGFTERYTESVWQTARMLPSAHAFDATWGEQEFLNNYFRFHPEALAQLPCGCNYQYTAVRRAVRCPGQPVYIAHAWSSGMSKARARNPFTAYMRQLWNETRTIAEAREQRLSETVPAVTDREMRGLAATVMLPVRSCPHQSWACDEDASEPILRGATVNVLTRTASRPGYFWHNSRSVRSQSHRHIRHIVATDTPGYATADVVVPVERPAAFGHEGCTKCNATRESGCSHPPASAKGSYAAFLECYCSTPYPPNGLLRQLYAHTQEGYILYLDDDKRLADAYVVSRLLSRMRVAETFVLWRTTTGRIVPRDETFERCAIVHGDIDAGNLVFHTSLAPHADWGTARCGDYRAATQLLRAATPRCHDVLGPLSHPVSAKDGGGGQRRDLPGLSVVITTTGAELRTNWVALVIRTYFSDEYRFLVRKIVLVWNSRHAIPEEVAALEFEYSARLRVVATGTASLNNRWIHTLPHITTDLVLNLDDDMMLLRPGIECLMATALSHPEAVLGPFARSAAYDTTTRSYNYSFDELLGELDAAGYFMLLPRVLMLRRVHLEQYASLPAELHGYIDDEPAHSDDILMGLAVPQAYRVIPPRGSLLDFDTVCRGQFKRGEYLGKVGGLGLTPGRGSARTAALNNLSAHFTPVFHSQAGTCQAETGQPIKVGRGEATVLLAQMQGRMQALEALCDSKLHRFADSAAIINDLVSPINQGFVVPTLRPSERCPSREDILNTPAIARWTLWEDVDCVEGCRMRWRTNDKVAPRCLRRQAAEFSVHCHTLPAGCYSTTSELTQRGNVVVDTRAAPTYEASEACPSRADVLNTPDELRWDIWDDPAGESGCRYVGCCRTARGRRKTCEAPCSVKRRNVSFPVPCFQLPRGCPWLDQEKYWEEHGLLVRDLRYSWADHGTSELHIYRVFILLSQVSFLVLAAGALRFARRRRLAKVARPRCAL